MTHRNSCVYFHTHMYIYVIYTPNLGLVMAVFVRGKGAGPLEREQWELPSLF